MLYAVGTCLALDEGGNVRPPVPCTELHASEIVGYADLAGGFDAFPSEDAFDKAVFPECERLAVAFIGRRLRGDLGVSWFPLGEASWAAGTRKVECAVSHYRDGVAQHVTGSLSVVQTS